ncbi:MAG TPA: hypothetical protein VHB25_07860 [Gemmatimonadaceae bacterium]|nr:hypothetical protein [Gemmatimonadaceae bacterium]
MKRFGLVISLFAVFAIAFEGTCRIEDRIRYGMPIFSPMRQEEDLVVRDRLGMHGRPNAQYEQFALNSLGMRGPEVSVAKPARTLRVVTVGASETFGLYETAGREYPRQLEDSLRAVIAGACAAGSIQRVEVLNAALFGMAIPTSIQDLRLRVAPTHPDVVVAYPPSPTYLQDELPRAAPPDSGAPRAGSSWKRLLYPRALGRVRDQVKALLPLRVANWIRGRDARQRLRRHPPGWRFTSVPQDRLAAYDADLRALVGTIRAIGAIPMLATHGNAFPPGMPPNEGLLHTWEQFYPRATGTTIVAFDSAARLVTLRVARDSGVVVVDAQTLLHDRIARDHVPLFADYAHFNNAGATVMAGAVARAMNELLASRGALACAPHTTIAARSRAGAPDGGTP